MFIEVKMILLALHITICYKNKANKMSFFKKLFGKTEEQMTDNEDSAIPNTNIENESKNQQKSRKSESVRILPRIKVDYSHEIYANDQLKLFIGNPMPTGIEITEDQKPIVKALYEDLILCFAVDEGNSYKILQNEVFKNNPNLNKDILHQASVNALIEEIGEQIKMNGDPNHIIMITAGGNFEAAIILLDYFWEQMHQIINGNAIISIPARDLLFICKEGNQDAMKKLKEITKGYFDNPDTQGLLSKALYLKEIGKSELKIIERTF